MPKEAELRAINQSSIRPTPAKNLRP
jgi:hypothetical protein